MKLAAILLVGLAAITTPAQAQCGPSHGGQGGCGSGHGHGSAGEKPSKKVTATNTLCPVMGREVKPGRDREVVVGGRTYLVCCDGCGPELAEHKDKYLDKNGMPLNAPKGDKAPEAAPPSSHEGHQH